ncbi:SDR family NAD(P)-dependent oxidoreductase [Catenuloplanes atrovinosus]|uniref:NAD(P)-dependent dehydrogenase (Short-subunit alcohol dehydrogenase family) n=1 Tax=Catenuloplanes atrovinosus TaxID=137266 RepID=A0AAE3YMZ0_9ACTN|nr:SDR family NAD(P)-dependent oxidoreductase [Catenuloplanes atrovinosus]MDR7276754.1 NAD(P)-dependent dehydrogenase (short-subunit alcohol dehydrogenase family) [Catenuloplanes atrovinosus]
MTITFITGANKGLGHETARRLIAAGHTVLLGARDPEAGAAAATALGARFVRIDVTDDASVAAAADDVARHEGHVDVLVNNAGVNQSGFDPAALTGADTLRVLDVNVAGVVRVTTAFLPLLRGSADPVIINVGSAMGDLAATHDPDRPESGAIVPVYAASKAALTMLTSQYARALPEIRINTADPGYTATALNGHSGPQTVTEGTDAVVALATEGPGRGSDRFVARHGEITWALTR